MSVELLDSMGGDIDIVNAARVSYGKKSEYQDTGGSPCLSEADAGLLNYLMRERHGTPFEMVQFRFRIKCPIGVGREWLRHRIGSFNEISTRYVEWERDYYVPQPEDVRRQVGKPGHYKFTHLDDPNVLELYVQAIEQAFHYYELLLESGLAKEVARNVLPMGSFTQFIWSVNLRSLLNFLSLRTAPNALREIQICAGYVEELAQTVVPASMSLWNTHERGAP